MKTVTLFNPEAAQKVFQSNEWTYTVNFYIKISDENSESVLVNAEVATQQGEGNLLKIGVGTTYEISLTEFEDTVSIEFEDVKDLGALLRMNGTPYLLRVFKNAGEEQISTIGSIYPKLRIIDFGSAKNIQNLQSITECTKLEYIDLSYCPNLADISLLPSFSKLHSLCLDGFSHVHQFVHIGKCFSLQRLSQNDSNLRNLHHITALKNLKMLEISENFNITNIKGLSKLNSLSSLKILSCFTITDITPIGKLTNLSELDLSYSDSISDISSLGKLLNLKSLILTADLSEITPLGNLANLTSLQLLGNSSLSDISSLSSLVNLTTLQLIGWRSLYDITALGCLTNLTTLQLSECCSLSDISALGSLANLTFLNLSGCRSIPDISPLGKLENLFFLDLSRCDSISDISSLSKLANLELLDLSFNKLIIFIYHLIDNDLNNLKQLRLKDSPNIRDFSVISKLKHLKKLTWIDPVACSEVLMQSALNREDLPFIEKNIEQWNSELLLCKDANLYSSLVLSCANLLPMLNREHALQEVAQNMRARGLQSEAQNELEPFIWEKWCAMVTALPYREARACLSFATTELKLEQETFVLLGPVVLACADLLDNNPENEKEITAWVGEQLALLAEFPHLERQIAPSAAVYYASIQEQTKVGQWLIKATDEKMPLWRERVLTKLVGFYGAKQQFSQAKNLLAQMSIQEEKDEALAALSLSMASEYPVDAAFLLDEIHQNSIVMQTAKTLLHSESVLAHPQGIYQLFLHLQNTPEELEHCLSSLIEQDKGGKVAEAIQKLFVTPAGTNGISTAAFLLLCEHPGLLEFVGKRDIHTLKNLLETQLKEEKNRSVEAFVDYVAMQKMVKAADKEELITLLKINE
jgi:Leucine-rich repeat (LRR) protein